MAMQGGCGIREDSRSSANTLTWEFEGIIESVELLSQYDGEVYIADVDPCFVVAVRLVDPLPPLGKAPGETVSFGIQSPTMLFMGRLRIGQSYTLRLWGPADDPEEGYFLSVE